MPWRDWQFWVVTGLFISALWLIVGPFLPQRRKSSRRVKLTVGGKERGEGR